MYRVMEPVFCPFSGRYLHHLRLGKAVKCPRAADRKLQSVAKRYMGNAVAPYILDDRNVIVSHSGTAAVPAFNAMH